MDRQELREELRRGKAAVEDAANCVVTSFRAPDFSIAGGNLWALEAVAEAGFRVDSSIFPIAMPRYGIGRWETGPHDLVLDDGATLLEVPAPRRTTRGLPVLGQVLDYVRDPLALFEQQWTTYGAVSQLHLLGRDPWLMLLGPDAQEAVLTNRDKAFANGPAWSYLVGPFFHGGLMLLDFEEHHVHRRVLQQAFTRDRLAGRFRDQDRSQPRPDHGFP